MLAFCQTIQPAVCALPHEKPSAIELTLENGLKLIMLEDHSFPVVSCLMWYHVGARNEVPGTTGLAHLTEHLLFGQVGSFKKGEIGQAIVRSGGQFNGFTSDDFMTFFETLPPAKLELAIKIEAERMRQASFGQGDVETEIAQINKEFESQSKDPQDVLAQEVRASAFEEHPYHHPTMGWQNEVQALTVQDAKAFYNTYFWPDNATLVIVGDFKEVQAQALVKKYFEDIDKAPQAIPPVKARELIQKGERRVSVRMPQAKQEVIQVAYHAPALCNQNAQAMVVLEKLLDANFAGRLKPKLVNTKIVSSCSVSFEARRDPGLFLITLIAPAGTGQQKALEALDAQINLIRQQPPTEAELKRAKNLAEFAFASEAGSPYHQAFHLGYFDCLSNWQQAKTWPDKIRSVTAQDLTRVAKEYLNPDERTVGFLASSTSSRFQMPKPLEADDDRQTPQQGPAKSPVRSKQFEHLHLTGYKVDDAKLAEKPSDGPQVIPQLIHGMQEQAATTKPKSDSDDANSESAANEQKIPEIKRVQERILKNGVRLLVYESHISPIVQVSGSVLAGDAFDPPAKRGIAQLLSQACNQGSIKHAHAQLAQAQEDMGLAPDAMINFSCDSDTINFSTRCLSRDLFSQFVTIAECLMSPALAEDDLERSKQDAIAAIKAQEGSTAEKVERVLLRNLLSPQSPYYPGEPFDRAKSITNLKLLDLKEFHGQHVFPQATTISVAGDVTIEAAAQMAEKAFAEWTSGKSRAQRPTARVVARKVLKTSLPLKDKSQAYVSFGKLIGIAPNHLRYADLLIADCILGKHPIYSRIDRAFAKVPELSKAGTADAVSSRMVPLAYETCWSLSLPVDDELLKMASDTISTEMKKFEQFGIEPQEMAEAKRYLLGSTVVSSMSNLHACSRSVLAAAMADEDPNFLAKRLAGIRQADLDSVNKFIHSNFKPEQSSMVVASNPDAIRTSTSSATKASGTKEDLQPSGNSAPTSRSSQPMQNPVQKNGHEDSQADEPD
jgi:zinc protease